MEENDCNTKASGSRRKGRSKRTEERVAQPTKASNKLQNSCRDVQNKYLYGLIHRKGVRRWTRAATKRRSHTPRAFTGW